MEKLVETVGDYMACSDEERLVIALWIVHTHVVQYLDTTPYLLITSPEPRCGKSTLMKLLEYLCPRPAPSILPSEAVVYREIEARMPTMLLDEVDAIFNPKSAKQHEGLRALLNAGFDRGAKVPRCVGKSMSIQYFDVYCAKAIAGIGTLPDTIVDRSIPIRLQRKTSAEKVKRFRRREVQAVTDPIRTAISKWAADNGALVAEARPDMPDELHDRARDGCEPLVAIADALGYGVEARAALVSLFTSTREDSTESAQVKLLRDLRDIYAQHTSPGIRTEHLLSWLHGNGNGWASWYGGLDSRGLAALLKPYGIHPKNVRDGDDVGKGYHRDQFAEAWTRYVPAEPEPEPELAAV